MKKLFAAASALMLAGCLGPEHFVSHANDRCLMAGYAPGTAHYNACPRVVSQQLSQQVGDDFSRAMRRMERSWSPNYYQGYRIY